MHRPHDQRPRRERGESPCATEVHGSRTRCAVTDTRVAMQTVVPPGVTAGATAAMIGGLPRRQ